MYKQITLVNILVAAIAILYQCTPVVSGGGTEDVNARIVTGMVFMQDGTPASGAEVTLAPADFDPVRGAQSALFTDTTDEQGVYSISLRDSGLYTARIVRRFDWMQAIVAIEAVRGDTTTFPSINLSRPGSIKVLLPDSVDRSGGYVYIPGTTIASPLNQTGQFVLLDSVPAGTMPSVNYGAPASLSRAIRLAVPVLSAETTTVFLPEWRHAATLQLNTTPAGADVAQNVYDFPVLVRLSSVNFNFGEARSDGADIRFTKSDGTPLPCEIERWDAGLQQAEIWVTVDTVFGNNSVQSITMHWGASTGSATTKYSSAAVFDSSGGFEGVWHLGELSGKAARDASRNGITGTYRGGLPRGESGLHGICQNIVESDSDYIDMGDVLNPGTKDISIGVWVKRAASGSPQAILAKTNGGTPSATFGYLLSFDPYNLPHFHLASGGARWGDDSTFEMAGNLAITDTTTWHYLFIVINRSDNTLCKMYVDGTDKTGPVGGNIIRINDVANKLRLCIGTESDNNNSFKGAIAEVTIAYTTRSADWVKLSYMNQKELDVLVKW